MNIPKLVLFLVLLCFPNQPFYVASGLRIGGLGKIIKDLVNSVDSIAAVCDLMKAFSSKYNCSSVFNTALYHTNDVDSSSTMPDVSFGKFVVNIFVGGGDSPQNVPLIVDTTLDYTFMLCQPCGDSCSTNLPVFDPSLSNTFSNYTCDGSECPNLGDYVSCSDGSCTYNYTDSMYVSSVGSIVNDTFSFGTSSFPNIAFGCGVVNTGNYGSSIGFLGLGSGGLSLLSLVDFGKFSYCVGSSGDGALFLGSSVQFQTNSVASTDFLTNTLVPRLYYVNFTGASVGGQYVDIPSTAYLPQPDGAGGMILYTATTFTYLEESAYNAVKDEFVTQMSSYSQVNASDYGLDLCFAISPGQELIVPQLTLHFDGAADMNPNNYTYFKTTSDETVGCLLVLPLQGVSILGTYMQLDMHMIYDVSNGKLLFESADCSNLT